MSRKQCLPVDLQVRLTLSKFNPFSFIQIDAKKKNAVCVLFWLNFIFNIQHIYNVMTVSRCDMKLNA